MPSYDFKCPVCLSVKPVFAKYDEELRVPNCDGCMIPMSRDWSSPAIHFKGNGWGHQ